MQLSKDPVCGMDVTPDAAKGGQTIYKNKIYYFCNPKCKSKFETDPEKYLTTSSDTKTKDLQNDTAEYTCPMDPEIRQIGPGSCPICGMALEPVVATADTIDDTEYKLMLKRFYWCAAFSLPLLFITMGGRNIIVNFVPIELLKWLELVLATPVVLWGAWPFFEKFWTSLITRNLNMFTLIGLGVGIAYDYSLVVILFPGFFPDSFRDSMTGEIGLYFEAAAVIVTLVLLGQVLELKARGRTSSAIKSLLGLAAKTAAAKMQKPPLAKKGGNVWQGEKIEPHAKARQKR